MTTARMIAFACAGVSVAALVAVMGYLWWLLRAFPLYRRLVNLLYPLSQLAIALYALWAEYVYDLETFVVVLTAVCGVACAIYDLVLFRGLLTAERRDIVAHEAQLLEQQVDAQERHLESIAGDARTALQIRRGMAARLEEVQAALRAGDAEVARASLDAAAQIVRPARVSFCAHPVVDALLASKVARCDELGIPVSVKVEVPRDIALPDVELCAVFANLIDNAINACRALGPDPDPASEGSATVHRGFIEVDALVAAGCFSLQVRNACAAKGPAVSRRASGLDEHGWGISIVEALAKRHNGTLACTKKADLFTADLTLQLA